jgi:type VI secretion system protein ImpJ
LLTDKADRDEFAHLGIARVVERRPDNTLVLDEHYIPTCLDSRVSPRLMGFVKEIEGLLHHRGEALAARLSDTAQGVGEITDLMLLQVVNRFEPLLAHLRDLETLHPERLYAFALQLAGELATFTRSGKRPVDFAPYHHYELRETFAPLIEEIRRSLSMVLEQKAVAIPLEERKYGIRVATLTDRSLLTHADFVLAASAQMPADLLQRQFPLQVKIGPVEKIRDLVTLALPGIGLRVLAVAPRQIPYHAGFSYFELDQNSDYWKHRVDVPYI